MTTQQWVSVPFFAVGFLMLIFAVRLLITHRKGEGEYRPFGWSIQTSAGAVGARFIESVVLLAVAVVLASWGTGS